jgi:hypothetical protein
MNIGPENETKILVTKIAPNTIYFESKFDSALHRGHLYRTVLSLTKDGIFFALQHLV